MADLSTADRERIWRGLMRYWSRDREEVDGVKSELQATVNETDDWIDDNQASYNSALTYGSNYTATQKTLIFCAVALARQDIELLRKVLGGVD